MQTRITYTVTRAGLPFWTLVDSKFSLTPEQVKTLREHALAVAKAMPRVEIPGGELHFRCVGEMFTDEGSRVGGVEQLANLHTGHAGLHALQAYIAGVGLELSRKHAEKKAKA